ncbi:ShlB/FhaC/HecB family hemolysin secretion/activation protein [Aquitalea sp.]|uniref:ShlB/FhaC/HecB family hemolysin secretion/activation protein n=1 Tax=Aquitalea sp. TaxID=1872623 RepID=UPI002587543E|nr:ShlB/FhaC/HecB family hemolysin secretion/activation protein [Aquitalea sp.]
MNKNLTLNNSFHKRRKFELITIGVGIYSCLGSALATPSGGQLIREIDQQNRIDIQPKQAPLQLDINSNTNKKTDSTGDDVKILITEITLRGNHAFSQHELHPIFKDDIGNKYNLKELKDIAQKIENFYHTHNYAFAHAYIPPQEISDGKLIIEIKEGTYGKIKYDNQSKLKEFVISNTMRSVIKNETIQTSNLESALIRLNKIAGIKATSTLEAGTEDGQADLTVNIESTKALSVNVSADNLGNKSTGHYRAVGDLTLNNPLNIGDQVNIKSLISNPKNQYQRINYLIPTNIVDSKIGITYSKMQYAIDRDMANLGMHGYVSSRGIYLQQPVITQNNRYSELEIKYEERLFNDMTGLYEDTNKKKSKIITTSYSSSGANVISNRSLSNFSASYSIGRIAILSQELENYYQRTTRIQGTFSKLAVTASHEQWITNSTSVFGQINMQWADKNLISAEKIGLGGVYAVRAYSANDAAGDVGFVGNLEIRQSIKPQIQASLFYDYGQTHASKNSWGEYNPLIRRAAIGTALVLANKGGSIKLTAALPVAPGKSSNTQKAPSAWIQTNYIF